MNDDEDGIYFHIAAIIAGLIQMMLRLLRLTYCPVQHIIQK